MLRAGLLAAAATAALAACEPKTAIRGNLPRESKLEQVQIDTTDKQQVRDLLGTPSTIGTFDDDVWYYFSRRTEQWAFFEPEIVEHRVLALYFDAEGVLRDKVVYTKDDLQDIDYAERETPTSGRELTFLEQIFGNMDRFRK